jgi:membrane-associated phospholipid phosphatase
MTTALRTGAHARFSFTRSRLAGSLALAISLSAPLALPLGAQEKSPDAPTVVPRDTAHAERHQTLFTYRDAALAAGFVGLTFAMFPADKHLAQRLQDQDLQTIKSLDQSAKSFEWITSPGAFVIGGGLYTYGRLAHHPDIADLGWHGTEAVLISSGITGLLKGTLGRARPFVTNDTNPRDFKFGKGFSSSDRQSFPSGHTTTAFAAASSVTSEVRRLWPKYTWYVAPVLYGGATLVGVSRMYHNKHWASDVVLGAGIGTFAGLKVVRFNHTHKGDRLDRWLLGANMQSDGAGGAALAWNVAFR